MPAGDQLELLSILAPPVAARHSGLHQAIEKYFQLMLFLLVVTGFVTLSSTGRLDTPSIALVSAALLLRGYLMLRGRTVAMPERWTSLLTLIYVVFYAADLFAISGNFVDATVHLVLFIMVVKIFSLQRSRDHLYLAVISFLEVLAAAVLTVDTVFFAAFCLFLLLAVATFISMEMKRSADAATALPAPRMPNQLRRMVRSLSTVALLITAAVVVGAAGIFFLLPRLSAGYLSAYAPRNQFVSGFSDRVRLGEIGLIKQSDSVVMHIEIEGDRTPYADLKWRGVALSLFDGRQWTNPGVMEAYPADGRYDPGRRLNGIGRYNLGRAQARARNLPAEPHGLQPLLYKVVMEPIGTSVVFLTPVPVSLQARMSEIAVDDNGAVYNLDRSRMTESYTAASLLPSPDPALLRRATRDIPPDIALNYLQLPGRVDPRIVELAQQVVSGAANDYDRAAAVERYLRTHYGYSLQMASSPPPDPLAYFLFDRKQGHCEYFASAMAVMLRTLGIPTRLVNGFRGSEYNDLTGNYIVRARDAHSWVEVYIPGYAWVSFDPTPADPNPAVGAMHRVYLYLDAAREFWREWVINYDFLHQRTLTITALAQGRTAGDQTRSWFRRRYQFLLDRTRQLQASMQQRPQTWSLAAAAAIMLCLLLFNGPSLWRILRRRRLARAPEKQPAVAATIWYTRMTRTLARKGFRKDPAQTPGEFVASISDPSLQTSVSRFTCHYERARFGKSAEDAARLPQLFQDVSR